MYYKYAYPELFDGVPRPDFRAFNDNLVIYGAGFQGLLAAYLLERRGIRVLCFGDRAENKQNTTYHGLPVYSPEEMARRYPNAMAIVTPYNLRPVYEYVRDELGYGEQTVTPFSLFLEFDPAGFSDLPEIPDWYREDAIELTVDMFLRQCVNLQTAHTLLSAAVSVTEVCNLRCRNCVSFMPNYSKPRHFEFDAVLRDIQALIKGRRFQRISLEGGELFLWEPLPRLIRALRDAPEIMALYLATNGTVLPGQDLLDALSHPKVGVRISDYGALVKRDQLSSLFQRNHVQHWFQLQKWYELSMFHRDPWPEETLKDVVNNCFKATGEGSFHIADGKLFRCPNQANLHNLGVFLSSEKDYVDLRDPDQERVQRRITEFMDIKHMPPVIELCRHCVGRSYINREVPPAQQLAPGEKIQVRFV